MSRLFVALFLLCGIQVGSTQSKSVSPFNAISTSGSVQVELIQGDSPKVDYTIIKGDSEDLIIEVKGQELQVKIKSNSFWNRSETKAKVTVYYQTLKSIDCAAGSSIRAENEIVSTSMDIESSSGANCNVMVKSDDLNVDSSSGSKVIVHGTSNSVNYDASSGARIDAEGMMASVAVADVSSGASIALHASKKLNADASSGGSIKYKGDPEKTNIHSGFSGSIKSY